MEKRLNQQEMKKRLEKLEILEKKEKDKLANLRKKLEVFDVLEDKEKKKLEKMKKWSNEKNRKIKNIGKLALIGTLGTATILGINEYAKHDVKKKNNQEIEQGIINTDQKNDSTAIFPNKTMITVDILKEKIVKDKMDPMISYDNLVTIINAIKNDKVREDVIDYLKAGKIIEVQEMFGMKKNSKYPSNKATGKIDANTLKKFSEQYFGLYGKEILTHKDIPQDVKTIYQKFLLGEIDNNDANYMILSKTDFYLYLFTKNHKLLNRQITLLGKDIKKDQERVPYTYYKTNKGVIYHNKETNTDTPEWLFKIERICKLEDNYISDWPKVGLVSIPVNIKTQKIEARYEYKKYEKRFHPTYLPPEDPDKYQEAMNSSETDDNAVSHGCPNVENIWILIDNLTIGKSVEYTTEK